MSVLLHIDSSPLGSASISRTLSAAYVEAWQKAHPEGHVITRDLTTSPLSVLDATWVAASFAPPEARTPEQNDALAFSDILINELRTADEYIIGVPMHNFTIPGALKLWIDQIARRGETFSYATGSPVGTLVNKKATFIVASGAVYGPGSAMASYNFVEPYLRTVFGFLGVSDIHFHLAGDAKSVALGQVDRDEFLRTHVNALSSRLQVAQPVA
jgi:FMN-dependent NADH-azoreductase